MKRRKLPASPAKPRTGTTKRKPAKPSGSASDYGKTGLDNTKAGTLAHIKKMFRW
jgi:hypothetical protein